MKLCQNAHSMHFVCFADLQHMYIYLCDILLYIGNTGSCQINTLCSLIFVQNEGIPSLLTNVSVLLTLDLLLQQIELCLETKGSNNTYI